MVRDACGEVMFQNGSASVFSCHQSQLAAHDNPNRLIECKSSKLQTLSLVLASPHSFVAQIEASRVSPTSAMKTPEAEKTSNKRLRSRTQRNAESKPQRNHLEPFMFLGHDCDNNCDIL